MKKSRLSLTALIAIPTFVVLAWFIVPLFLPARFDVINQTDQPVTVSAHWRDKTRDIGQIPPLSTQRFRVDEEAAMRISVRYQDGHEQSGEPIYFTRGLVIRVTITPEGVDLRYDFDQPTDR